MAGERNLSTGGGWHYIFGGEELVQVSLEMTTLMMSLFGVSHVLRNSEDKG
jgi:hypothetical protein